MRFIFLLVVYILLLASPAWGAYCNSCPDTASGANKICESPDGTADGLCGWTVIDGGNGNFSFTTTCDNTDALGCTDLSMTYCASVVKTGTDSTDQFAYKLLDAAGVTDVYIQFYIKMMTTPTLPSNGTDWGILFLGETVNDPQSQAAEGSTYFGIYRNTVSDYRWAVFDLNWVGDTWSGTTHAIGSSSVSMNGSKWYGIRMHAHNGAAVNGDYVDWWIDDGPDGTWHTQTSISGLDFEKIFKYIVLGDNDITRPANFQITGLKVSTTAMPPDCARVVPPDTTSSLTTPNGFTFNFNPAVRYGQFINGDYWVLSPVTITSITPSWDGVSYGWEIDPIVDAPFGFQKNCAMATDFSAAKVPSLPITITGDHTVVKTAPGPNYTTAECIKTVYALTVLSSVPANNGADTFRPTYIGGTTKTLLTYSDARTDLIPSLTMSSAVAEKAEPIGWVTGRFRYPWIDHAKTSNGNRRWLRPVDYMEDYGSDHAQSFNNSFIRVMFGPMTAEKKAAVVAITQFSIDHAGLFKAGRREGAGGGEDPCHRLIYAWYSTMFPQDTAFRTMMQSDAYSHYDDTHLGATTPEGVVLFGLDGTYREYWTLVATDGGDRTKRDKHGYIDGGHEPGWGYHYCCIAQPWKGEILATKLMPELQQAWNSAQYAKLNNHVERWVNFGTWTLPDPCAPYDGTTWSTNYGVTYGPVGGVEGAACIAGSGRFPGNHGINKDGGLRKSAFQTVVWSEYVYGIPDTIKPTVTAFSVPGTYTLLTVPISTFTAIDNLAVTGYLITETSATPSSSDPRWVESKPLNYVFSTSGSKILYAWAKDLAGNVSLSMSDEVVITLESIDNIDIFMKGPFSPYE